MRPGGGESARTQAWNKFWKDIQERGKMGRLRACSSCEMTREDLGQALSMWQRNSA